MTKLQNEFIEFHDKIKLGTYEENQTLRDKRDLLLDELEDKLKDEKVPGTDRPLKFNKIDQGSYAMNTGIRPKKDEYDIDVGVIFDVSEDEYGAKKLKRLVYDKLNSQHNRTVDFNRPCITVKYADGYHVDLPIYAKNGDKKYLAWGKKSDDCTWEPAAPQELNDWVRDLSSDAEERRQFRRCVRALKKWKEKHFKSTGNEAPPSIGLTIQARKAFKFKSDNDLDALIVIVKAIKSAFKEESMGIIFKTTRTIIKVKLPVTPKKNVYYKMTDNHVENFYQKTVDLLEALEAARDKVSSHETSKILRKVFGTEFPLVEDAKATKSSPYVSTGQNA